MRLLGWIVCELAGESKSLKVSARLNHSSAKSVLPDTDARTWRHQDVQDNQAAGGGGEMPEMVVLEWSHRRMSGVCGIL